MFPISWNSTLLYVGVGATFVSALSHHLSCSTRGIASVTLAVNRCEWLRFVHTLHNWHSTPCLYPCNVSASSWKSRWIYIVIQRGLLELHDATRLEATSLHWMSTGDFVSPD